MKKYFLLFILISSSLFSFSSTLSAVGDEEMNSETQEYNPVDYDPGIPPEWIREDGTFGE